MECPTCGGEREKMRLVRADSGDKVMCAPCAQSCQDLAYRLESDFDICAINSVDPWQSPVDADCYRMALKASRGEYGLGGLLNAMSFVYDKIGKQFDEIDNGHYSSRQKFIAEHPIAQILITQLYRTAVNVDAVLSLVDVTYCESQIPKEED